MEFFKERAVNIIDAIISASSSLTTACTEVIKELSDEPLYLETEENFIQVYQEKYMEAPLMPLSIILTYFKALHDTDGAVIGGDRGQNPLPINDTRLSGDQEFGDVRFKIAYGVRKVLNTDGPTTLADMPGVKQIFEMFNGSIGREQISMANFEGFVKNLVNPPAICY